MIIPVLAIFVAILVLFFHSWYLSTQAGMGENPAPVFIVLGSLFVIMASVILMMNTTQSKWYLHGQCEDGETVVDSFTINDCDAYYDYDTLVDRFEEDE